MDIFEMASHSFKETPKKKFGEVRRRKSKKQIIKSITLPELQNNKERNHENECQKNDTKFSANSKPPLRKTLSNNVNGIVSDGCNNNRINANGKTKDLRLQDAVIDVGADIFQTEQIEEESFHTAIRPILTLIQFAGLMPVRGIWDPTPKSLHFQHSSIRTALSVLLLLSFAVLEILAIKYTASVVTSNGSQTLSKVWEATRGTIIYGNAMLSICIFLRLASHWKDLMRQWHNTEEKLKQWPFPRLSKRFIIITAAIIFPSLITHILSTLVYLRINFYPEQKYFCTILLRNEPNSSDTFEKYSVLSNFYIFDGIIDYRVWIALPVNILSRFGILIWVVSDIFIILVSIGLSERFTQFNWRAKDAMSKKMVPADWKSLRNHFNLVTDLVRAVDREVSGLILLSFVRNLCRICLMFSKIVILCCNAMEKLYYCSTIFLLMVGTFLITKSAARIYEESRASLSDFYSCPTENYCREMEQLQTQISTDEVALTGLRIFSVTRSFMLMIAGFVFTCIVILLQFHVSLSINDENDCSAL
ncbi:gustatory receptor 5a for trehalose-like [Periplaneta americana]|uniref:gustatory receptor 5a for trehalose-like n=1 Tax=Periplaneta americana TaxID=6978 RepID=UPI0037E7AD6B